MNADTLLKHFDRISEAPDAVARLRGFIFDLAMRGKLVEQDPSDEPAAEILQRARKVPAVIGDQQIPASWVNAPMEALAANTRYPIGDGDHGQIKPACYQDSGIPYIRVADLGWGTFEPNGLVYIPEDVHEQNLKSELLPGDVLIAKTGATIGKCCIVPESIPKANTTSSVGKVTVDQEVVLPRWIIYYFLSGGFKEKMWAVSKKTAQPGFNISNLKQFIVPLPPLAEQQRIVAKVDELMALCDQLEAAENEREARRDRLVAASLHRIGTAPADEGEAQDEAQTAAALRQAAHFHLDHLPRLTTRAEHIKQLRQTILSLAVRGRLVPQDPNDEPATELLKRIQTEKARLVQEGVIPRSKSNAGKPKIAFELPSNWQAIRFDDVCNLVTSGSRGWAEYYADSGPKFVRAQNIRFGRLRLDDLACVNPPANSEGKRTQVQKGDLLVVITGAGVTNPALMDRDLGEAYVSQHVALLKPTSTSLSRWLLLCLMSGPGGRDELVERAYGAGKPGLNLDNVRSLNAPLPPLAEQHRIVAKVDELMALCDQLETQLATREADSRCLLEAVLRDALAPALEKAA